MQIHQSTAETSPAGDRLGDLAQLFGLASEKNCEQFVAKAKKESLLFGQVLVSDGAIEPIELRKIVECQSLIRERLVSMEQAALLFETSVGAKSLQEASSQLDFDAFSAKRIALLGGLLLDAKFATEEHLKFGLDQQEQSILPIGRILVSVGLLPEDLLSASVQAQTLIRLGRISREAGIKALLDLKIKHAVKPRAKRKEQTFYQRAQDRTYPSLEQILASGHMISNADLTNAMEKNLLENKPMETVLLESASIDQEMLDAAREVEKLVRSDSLDYEQTKEVFKLLKQGRSFNEALLEARESNQESVDVITLASLLKKFGCINNAELASAFDRALHNSEILTRVLLLTGTVDTDNLRNAEECLFLIQTQALSVDDAERAFKLSQSKAISIGEAIRQLQDSKVNETEIRADSFVPDSEPEFDEVKWQECWRTAMDAIAQKDLTSGRMLLESLRVEAGKSHASYYINCLDAIAETYVQDQNYELAERYYSFALDARLENFEIDSLTCAKGMNAMGKICYFQKRYSEAEKYVKEYVRICSKRLGANHSDVACGWQNIATIYQAQGRFNYAEHAYKRALKGCTETIGENHPTTIKVKNSYANLLLQIDRIKEAEKLFPTADGVITGTWRNIDEYLGETNTGI